jgi:UDP-N-acetylmuramoyl-tripeptide--D-alanyl-D-alanine ligase
MTGPLGDGPAAPYATLAAMREARPPSQGGAVDPRFTPDELARATGGSVLVSVERPIRGAAVDSREVQADQIFVALPGERTDGHDHLQDAVARGASALLISRPLDPALQDALGAVTVVRVADGLRALQALAAAWRRRFDPIVIGVTGSIAKTSVKEAVATVLAGAMPTLRSEGNRNNEIGLPLTVLAMRPEHRAAVLEMGMYVGGEIADLARIARPSIGVVTAVQGVHLSRIGSLDAIEDAKAELVEALPGDGTAILNADDPRVRRMAGRTAARVMTYGFDPDADVGAESVAPAGFDGMRFTLRAGAVRTTVELPGLGRMAVHNALAAAAVGFAAGLEPAVVVEGLRGRWSAPHRSTVRRAGGVAVVDDSYNASPGSVLAALELLGDLPGRRVAVLGEMRELGDDHDAGHREVGAGAAPIADLLVVVGPAAAGIAEAALEAGAPADRVLPVADRAAALDALQDHLRPGDVVLVKASRGAELDRLVEDLVGSLDEEGGTDR